MTGWGVGRETIDRQMVLGHLERVESNRKHADFLLDQARRHLKSARLVADADDPVTAFAAVYEGARKALTAVLAVQGLRPTSRGGHLAVQEAIFAQFRRSLGAVVTPFDWMRRTRHDNEYPAIDSITAQREDVVEALEYAEELVGAAETLVDRLGPY